jgi:hypothetical protein
MERDMSDDKKPALNKASVLPKSDNEEIFDRVSQLEERAARADEAIATMRDWAKFAEKNTKNVFGWAMLGALFGQLAEKLQK